MQLDTTFFLDMQLMQGAAHYDLTSKDDRLRSVSDLERFFFRLCQVLEPDLFLDVGASDGRIAKRARRRLPNARVVALEANPLTFAKHSVDPTIVAGNIEYRHTAISDIDGSTTFHMVADDGAPTDDEKGSLRERSVDPVSVASEEVTVSRLSTLFPPDTFSNCFMWIDVEGASEQVISGAKDAISKTQAILIEVEDREIWDGQWLASDLIRGLLELGMVPVARDFQSRYQYNILFVKSELVSHDRVRFSLAEHISRAGQKTA